MWINVDIETGRTVERIMFDLGIKCNHEHLVHSWTIDVEDFQIQNLFDSLEWNETLGTRFVTRFIGIFNSFRKKSTKELRLYIKQAWQESYDSKIHFDLSDISLHFKSRNMMQILSKIPY
ncbi:hypothetical protein C1645_446584 [Glomus cerebriforme]|uniref:Uncharacterized protein n=1 Tax=Glomus cerebriforme TaxID=658196 RepID=A0A397TEV6_9GLOM|nr:hypothetical protein C1645_446584 [Glomus cerebriforme]